MSATDCGKRSGDKRAGRTSSEFVAPREEVEGLADVNDERQATQEEDLCSTRTNAGQSPVPTTRSFKHEGVRALPSASKGASKSKMVPSGRESAARRKGW